MRTNLFMKIISTNNLHIAWKTISQKESNGGIDNVTLDTYRSNVNDNIEKLHKSLSDGNWIPQPYLNVRIPKKDNEERTIGLLSINDKIVQESIKIVIEPILERTFSTSSYAYRPGRGHQKCIRRAMHETKIHKDGFHIRCDIDNFFSSIDRSLLKIRLSHVFTNDKLLNLIDLCISMGSIEKDFRWVESEKGLPQGAILSPMLANFYLNSFDQSIDNKHISYLRYSDDIVLWTDSRIKAESISTSIVEYLQSKMGLSLNAPPTIAPCSEPFEFLGIVISSTQVSLSEIKKIELSKSIEDIELNNNAPTKTYLKRIEGINRYYLSVLPKQYRSLFENMFNNAKITWSKNNLTIQKQTLDLIYVKLLGNSCNSTDNKKNGLSNESPKQKQKQILISKRKLEYQRLEAENSELVIAGAGYYLGVCQRGLILKKAGQIIKLNSSAVKHISILSKGVTISSNLVEYCAKNQITTDFFGEHCYHLASLLSPSTVNSSLWTTQILIPDEISISLAKSIIIGKLKNQVNLCKYYNKYHKRNKETYEFNKLIDFFKQIEKSIGNLTIENEKDYKKSIIAYKASAAEKYWEYVGELLSDDNVEFYSRVKQGAVDIVNCMLNYGYAMLYPRIWQALLKRGLNPYHGFIHHSEGNPNLVFDFIELFRCQVVDRVVISMLQRKINCKVMEDGKLDDYTKTTLAQNIMTRLYRYETYRGEHRRLCDIIDIQASNLADSIISGSSYKPYLAKW